MQIYFAPIITSAPIITAPIITSALIPSIYMFVRKFNKTYGDESPIDPKEIEVLSFRVILKH